MEEQFEKQLLNKDIKAESIITLSEHICESSHQYAKCIAQALYEQGIPIIPDNLSKVCKLILRDYYLPSATMATLKLKNELRLIALEPGVILYEEKYAYKPQMMRLVVTDNKERALPEEISVEENSICANPYCRNVGMVVIEHPEIETRRVELYCFKCHVSYRWEFEDIKEDSNV